MIFGRLYLANIVVYTRLQFLALDIFFVKEEALLVGERVRMSLVLRSKPCPFGCFTSSFEIAVVLVAVSNNLYVVCRHFNCLMSLFQFIASRRVKEVASCFLSLIVLLCAGKLITVTCGCRLSASNVAASVVGWSRLCNRSAVLF